MATILRDAEIRKLIGKVIVDGDESCIRPNAYIIRLGGSGEFLNTGKEFRLGKKKRGIRVQAGHSVGVTALETLDFRREAVHTIYPGADLHGLLSPTTDLSREGIVAPATQVDAGYHGTLNWTITNTSNSERRFVEGERICRLAIFKLEEGETPEHLYDGDYQSQTGFVRSKRTGAPVGMKESEWEDARRKGGPEDILDELINSGYPWHILGKRLKEIDLQFKDITDEYASIDDAITDLGRQIGQIRERQAETPETVRAVLREETDSLQNRWLIASATVLFGFAGIVLAVTSSPIARGFLVEHGVVIGLGMMLFTLISGVVMSKQK